MKLSPGWASHTGLKRPFALIIGAWLVLVVLPTFAQVRSVLIWPLYRHDPDATGEVAYIMANGYAYLERLRAGADLYHMHRVQRIFILNEELPAGYDFELRRLQSNTEMAIAYLGFLGVPPSAISSIDISESALFGSLSEARSMAKALPPSASKVVVVTSAPHTRRSLLCFRRSLPEGIQSQVYSATDPIHSAELCGSIWLEYVKLVVYILVA
jgi:uncharacterized SAM-binding protein YcdF (DUF218 family)